jgi:hypothetical protein
MARLDPLWLLYPGESGTYGGKVRAADREEAAAKIRADLLASGEPEDAVNGEVKAERVQRATRAEESAFRAMGGV